MKTYLQEDHQTRIQIHFQANPAPEPDQVTWHFTPNTNESENAFSLEPGMISDDGKYKTHALKIMEYNIIATMVVNTSMEAVPEGEFHLEVHNIHGMKNYSFEFPHLNEDQIVLMAVIIAVILGLIALGLLISGVVAKKSDKICFFKKSETAKPDDLVEIGEGTSSEKKDCDVM